MTELWRGTLRKMRAQADEPVAYALADGHFEPTDRVADLPLNPLLDKTLRLEFTGLIRCTSCGRKTKRSFNQGYCYPCSQSLAEADICIIKPELCHFHDPLNPCRDNDFAMKVCFNPHVFYVSLTSGVKIGITRQVNVPTRWIDQGAVRAIPLAVLPDRFTVGKLEADLAKSFADKTHWMQMLKNENPVGELAATADEITGILEERGVSPLPADQRTEHVFRYPVIEYPVKVKSHNLDKTPIVEGRLQGIKGQYLIFDSGVINLRKYTGYEAVLAEGGVMTAERMDIDGTLDLHMFRPDETRDLVSDYIEACLAQGISELRIIHGKGVGVQREIVRSVLKDHPRVADFAHPSDPSHWGVTVVRLTVGA